MVESGGTSPRTVLRVQQARDWIATQYSRVSRDWFPVTGDAGNRQYYRGWVDGRRMILMDAPPAIDDQGAFVDICGRLRAEGLHAPEILMRDPDNGFLLLEDLGPDLYRDLLNQYTVNDLFPDAFRALAVMATRVDPEGLPEYGADTLFDDLHLFTDLYLVRHRAYRLPHAQRLAWRAFCEELVRAAMEQPRVFVHRDVHSCNLLRTEDNNPGIIDFQDAVRGPLTYDFVSLIWDRYEHWPRERIEAWMEQYRQMVAPGTDPAQWIYWCDAMGLQRNLRIVGRFAELKYSENKPGYIPLIPAFYRHILEVLPLYPRFAEVADWLGSDACAP